MSWSKYEKQEMEDLYQVSFSSGQFFVDIWDINKKFLFNGNGFSIEVYGGWKFFLSIDKVKNEFEIVSQTALLNIDLLDTKNKKMTKLVLYPHMWIYWSVDRNNFLENADHIRVMTVQNIDYKDYSFLNIDHSSDLFSTLHLFDNNFFSTIIEQQLFLRKSAIKWLSKIFTIFSDFNFPWEKYIEKYKALFLNGTKRSSYLAYKIEKGFIKLATNSKEDNVKNEISSSLKELLNLDPEAYKKTLNNIKQLHLLIIESSDSKYMPLRKDILEIWRNEWTDKWLDAYLYLAKIYDLCDQWNQKKLFYKELLPFLKNYLLFLGVRIDTWKISIEESFKDKESSLDYLTLFIEKLLIPKEGDFESVAFEDFVEIFEIYEILSTNIYNGQRARTWMYTNLNILKKTLLMIHTLYFQKERNERGLLEKKVNTSLSSQSIDKLSLTLDKIFSFYFINKKHLNSDENSNDMIIGKDYEQVKILFEEYLLALKDYEKYSVEYDKIKRKLLDIDTLLFNEDQTISEENLKKYLSQFNWFSSLNLKFSLWENFYRVENVSLSWQQFSFILTPLNAYEISEIKVNGVNKNGSYKLEVIKNNWNDKAEDSDQKDAWQYDFKNFFSLVFLSWMNINNNQNLIIIDVNKPQEDKFTRVFKQTKLIWEKTGILRRIKILQFDYDDIIATRNQDFYDVDLKDVFFSVQIDSMNFRKYDGIFYSKFILWSNSDESYFKDIKLKFYTDYERNKDNFLFRGSELSLIWKIPVNSFDELFSGLIEHIEKISRVEEQLNLSYPIISSEIKYILSWNKAFLKSTLSNGDIVNIVFLKDSIESFSFAWKNLLNRTIPYTEFTNYIP